jgi:glycosyltransferase involved in cell wall biosynthesis
VSPRLSIVIPAYNEADRLSSTLQAVLTRFDAGDTEIVVVDDGSDDDTADIARRLLGDTPGARVLQLDENRGKGGAVRAGVQASTGEIVMFMDADLATDLAAVDDALAALGRAEVVVGSRAVPGSDVKNATVGRAVMGRVFNRFVRWLARVPIHDTQCGFKAFRGPAAHLLFGLSHEDGFAFDAEVLLHARILGLRTVEIPVVWTAVDGSSVRPVTDSVRTAAALVRCVVRSRPARVRARARELGWDPASDTALVGISTGDGIATTEDERERDGSAA